MANDKAHSAPLEKRMKRCALLIEDGLELIGPQTIVLERSKTIDVVVTVPVSSRLPL